MCINSHSVAVMLYGQSDSIMCEHVKLKDFFDATASRMSFLNSMYWNSHEYSE